MSKKAYLHGLQLVLFISWEISWECLSEGPLQVPWKFHCAVTESGRRVLRQNLDGLCDLALLSPSKSHLPHSACCRTRLNGRIPTSSVTTGRYVLLEDHVYRLAATSDILIFVNDYITAYFCVCMCFCQCAEYSTDDSYNLKTHALSSRKCLCIVFFNILKFLCSSVVLQILS